MALAANIPPRTLQCFLSILPWDHQRMRDKLQWLVAHKYAHSSAVGIVDDSGNPKKGSHTAAVQWQ
ncbi:MAG: transposase [Planctomycetota bacterium]